MRKLGLSAAAALIATVALPALAADPKVVITNNGSERIKHVFIKTSGEKGWGGDLLDGIIPANKRRSFTVWGCEDKKRRDIRVIDGYGNIAEFFSINACEGSSVEVSDEDYGD